MDSLKFHETLIFFLGSRTASRRAVQITVLNGFIFGGSLLALHSAILPALSFIGGKVMSLESGAVASTSSSPPHSSENSTITDETLESAKSALEKLVTLLLLTPMLLISSILNTVWYADIAEHVHKRREELLALERRARGKSRPDRATPPPAPTPRIPFQQMLREEPYRVLLVLFLTMESWATYHLLPAPIGVPLTLLTASWTLAFYCYDYSWTLKGWPLERRLHTFESRWCYALGFGLPLSAACMLVPLFTSYVLYGLLFPLVMTLALITEPLESPANAPRIPIFWFAKRATLVCLRICLRPPPASARRRRGDDDGDDATDKKTE